MPTPDEIAAEINRLEILISSGATTVTTDGETVTFDLQAAQRRLQQLYSQLSGQRHKARRVRTIDLRNTF